MSEEIKLFPKDPYQAIAMLFVEKAVADGCTPEEAVKVYWDAYEAAGKAKPRSL